MSPPVPPKPPGVFPGLLRPIALVLASLLSWTGLAQASPNLYGASNVLRLIQARADCSTVTGKVKCGINKPGHQNLYIGTISEIPLGGTGSAFTSGVRFPVSLAFDPAGTLDVGNSDPSYAPIGTISEIPLGGTGSAFANGVSGPEVPDFAPTSVSEPSTLLLLGSGLAGLCGIAWKRHRRR